MGIPGAVEGLQQQASWRDYLSLTKPRVISLLLLTTLGAMLMAAEGLPPLGTILLTLLGGYLAAGGAGAINCYLDRDIDHVMTRTRKRPLPSRRIQPRQALLFGLVLSLLSFLILWLGVNLLSALLALFGIFYYVVIYTQWLKRSSTQNIVIGGAAGAIPPLVGWAAATGTLSAEPFFLFAIIFYWTPPHFWALALVRREDYARAGVPMLPVVYGDRATRVQIVLYSIKLFVLSLLPAALGFLGLLYGAVALALGGLFLYYAVRMLRDTSVPATWRLYKYSLLYLALLCCAMVVDKLT
jgi:protoheme IX farnesyltransferase